MYTGIVYNMRSGLQKGMPRVDALETEGDYWGKWDLLDQPFPPGLDTLPMDEIRWVVCHPRALEQDLYSLWPMDMISQRAAAELWPHLRNCCNRFETAINGVPYYMLRPNGHTLDCLNREESIVDPSPDDPDRILEAKRLRFFREQLTDPLIFMIPQYANSLLATESIRRLVEDANLNGFEFIDCENICGYY